jgi:hypothetical protein
MEYCLLFCFCCDRVILSVLIAVMYKKSQIYNICSHVHVEILYMY